MRPARLCSRERIRGEDIQGETHVATDPQMAVDTAGNWAALPAIGFPLEKTGKSPIFTMHKVGFLMAPLAECEALGIVGAAQVGDRCVLPTALIEINQRLVLCRMSLPLAEWAIKLVDGANSGKNRLPGLVQFSMAKGRAFAEIL